MKSRIPLIFILIMTTVIGCKKDFKVPKTVFTADAGQNLTGIKEFEVTLNADSLLPEETGIWTISQGLVDKKVYFDDKKNPKTKFHGLPGQTYLLRWTVTKGDEVAKDSISVSFLPLETEISNLSPSFYQTRVIVNAKEYDKGRWSINGKYIRVFDPNFNSNPNQALISRQIKLIGYANTTDTLTWTTWYGSVSASASVICHFGDYSEKEALEDLDILGDPRYYQTDQNGHVTTVFLGGDWRGWEFEDLKDYPSLQALKYLKRLSLYGDGISQFPAVIADYYLQLQFLDIGANEITKLPDNIGNLTKLDTLKMGNNQAGAKMTSLPESIGNLKRLKFLDLSGSGLTSIPDSFCNLDSLKYLELYGDFINKLPDNFGNLKNLEVLKGPALYHDLPASFSQLVNLRFCDIAINTNDTTVLPKYFGNLKKLQTLYLYGKFNHLPQSFGELSSLKELQVIGGSELKSLPDNFGHLQNLVSLRLATDFSVLPSSVSDLVNLKYLTIHGRVESLPEDIGKLKNLEEMHVDAMDLSKFPESIGRLSKLKILSAYSNQLTALPDSIGYLSNIIKMDLKNNKIHSFPKTISNISNTLQFLSISGNNVTSEELDSLKKMLPHTVITDDY